MRFSSARRAHLTACTSDKSKINFIFYRGESHKHFSRTKHPHNGQKSIRTASARATQKDDPKDNAREICACSRALHFSLNLKNKVLCPPPPHSKLIIFGRVCVDKVFFIMR